MATTHALTIRLPEPVYKAARSLARRKGISLNRLVQDAIVQQARRSTDARLEVAYDLLAEDAETCGVEDLLAVQAEVLTDD